MSDDVNAKITRVGTVTPRFKGGYHIEGWHLDCNGSNKPGIDIRPDGVWIGGYSPSELKAISRREYGFWKVLWVTIRNYF